MDTTLLKTFLELSRTRHFGKTADNLYITQSAVSARIKQLEDQLGQQLFTRTRNDIKLTPSGERLVPHAKNILAAWEQARNDVLSMESQFPSLTIGGVPSIWDIYLTDWLARFHQLMPNVAIRCESYLPDIMTRKLLDHSLDIGFVFEPLQTDELELEDIINVEFVLVSTRENDDIDMALQDNYVMVDWGVAFAVAHASYFPNLPPPAIRMMKGRMALGFIQQCGGAAYLPLPMIEQELENSILYRVQEAPVIERNVYAVYRSQHEHKAIIKSFLDLINQQV
jgi:DNA-binding transcriptional LysR family regulator